MKLLVLLAILFSLLACDKTPTSLSAQGGPDTTRVGDTLFIKDTLFIQDTIVVLDSLIIRDTLVIVDSKDTVFYAAETLVIRDTVVILDTVILVQKDSVFSFDTVYFSAETLVFLKLRLGSNVLVPRHYRLLDHHVGQEHPVLRRFPRLTRLAIRAVAPPGLRRDGACPQCVEPPRVGRVVEDAMNHRDAP